MSYFDSLQVKDEIVVSRGLDDFYSEVLVTDYVSRVSEELVWTVSGNVYYKANGREVGFTSGRIVDPNESYTMTFEAQLAMAC